jgi:hypothetical protein
MVVGETWESWSTGSFLRANSLARRLTPSPSTATLIHSCGRIISRTGQVHVNGY